MIVFDIILAIFLGWAFIKGLRNGFIHEVASLAALILGIYGAIRFSDYTAGLLIEHFSMTGKYLGILALALTFVAIVILVHFVGEIVDRLVKAVALGFVNKIFGAVFGLLKMAFILSLILFVVNEFDRKTHFLPKDKLEDSILYAPISGFFPFIFHNVNLKNLEIPKYKEKNKSNPIEI